MVFGGDRGPRNRPGERIITMAYKSSAVQQAANANRSKYAKANQYAQNAYADLDRYISDEKAAIADKYAQKQQTVDRTVNEKIKKYEDKKDTAERKFVSSKADAYADYMNSTNRYGVTKSALADAQMSDSGFADLLDMQAASEYEQTLNEVSSVLQQALQSYEDSIRSAEADGDEKTAELLRKRNEDTSKLQDKVKSMLESISSKISSIEKSEKSAAEKSSSSAKKSSSSSSNSSTSSKTPTANRIIIRKETN